MSTLSKNQIVVEYVVQDDDVKKVVGGMNTLTAKEKEALTELRKYNDQLKKTGSEGGKAVDQVSGKFGNMNSIVGNFGKTIAGVFAVSQIIAFAKTVADTTARFQQFQKAIDFASGSSEKGAENMEFLRQTANSLGLDLLALVEGYKGFAASSNLAGTSMQETNRQFLAVSKAAATLGLSADRTKLILAALSQIAGKGVVSMEDLRQQIGDSLPGALGIAAKAMGMNIAQFSDFVAKGEIASNDFLPKFATELEKTFGPNASKNIDTITASQNKFNTAIDSLVLAIGEKLEPFLKGSYDLAAGIATQLAGIGKKAKQETVENIALRRLESDLAKKAFDIAQEQGVWISRQSAARALIFDLDKKIDAQQQKNADLRINAASDFNGKQKIQLQQGEKTLKVLQAELSLLEVVAGVQVTFQQNQKKTQEQLEDEYKAKVKLLELDKKIAALRIQLRTEEGFERNLALLRNDVEYGKKRLATDNEFAAQGVQDAKDNARIQGLINQTKSKEVVATIKTEAEARKKEVQAAKDGIRELQNEQIKFENKKRTDAEESVEKQKKLNKELVDLEKEKQEKIKEIKGQSKKDDKQLKKDIAEITVQEWQAYSMVASAALDNVMNLYEANIDRQMNALNQKYAAEIRLADGNAQKIMELDEKKAAEEKKLREKEFRAQQAAAVAQVIFKTAPLIAEYFLSGPLAPLAVAGLAIQASQIAFIMAQPVPEFREGTKGKAYQGKAIVGEEGSELVVTQSGKVYKTPSTASLVNLSEKSHVIPAPLTEKILSGKYEVNSSADYLPGQIVARLESIEGTLRGLPFTNVQLDREGFFVYQEQRAAKTKRLNSKFKSPMLR